jgi:hypothetical protein
VKGPWTKEEDETIIRCIKAGITKVQALHCPPISAHDLGAPFPQWSEIAEAIPGRIGKQCRERWFNHLDPSIKKGGWSDAEDNALIEGQGEPPSFCCAVVLQAGAVSDT